MAAKGRLLNDGPRARLVLALKKDRVILFVGAGVSKNPGIPDFRELIAHRVQELMSICAQMGIREAARSAYRPMASKGQGRIVDRGTRIADLSPLPWISGLFPRS